MTPSPIVGWRLRLTWAEELMEGAPAEGHALVERHIVADLGGLADHHAHRRGR